MLKYRLKSGLFTKVDILSVLTCHSPWSSKHAMTEIRARASLPCVDSRFSGNDKIWAVPLKRLSLNIVCTYTELVKFEMATMQGINLAGKFYPDL